jgi:hypothetical protein
MFILVQHSISDPAATWKRVQQRRASEPPQFKLHHSIPTPDGSHAICIWEAESISALKNYLDPALGPAAKNEYFEVVNKEGVAFPTALAAAAGALA